MWILLFVRTLCQSCCWRHNLWNNISFFTGSQTQSLTVKQLQLAAERRRIVDLYSRRAAGMPMRVENQTLLHPDLPGTELSQSFQSGDGHRVQPDQQAHVPLTGV